MTIQREPARRARSVRDTAPPDDDAGVTWGVGAVASRLDIAASTLRTWERRYGVGPSHRTQGGHRRYTERDIERVELVRRLVARGVSAQDAARVARGMSRDELAAALSESPAEQDLQAENPVDTLVAAALTLDGPRLEELVTRFVRRATFVDSWTRVIAPFLTRVSAERSGGTLDLEGQNLAVQTVLKALEARRPAHDSVPEVVLATRTTRADSIPIIALDTALRAAEVRTTFIDADGVPEQVQAALDTEPLPRVLIIWSDHEEPWLPSSSTHELAVVRLAPGWPHEMRVGAGRGRSMVASDVRSVTDLVLDRIA